MARALPLGDALVATFPAEIDSIPLMRRLLGRWLDEAGATRTDIEDLMLASAEAAANAIEHAYGLAPGVVELRAWTAHGGPVKVTIRDFGNWRAPRGTHRGRVNDRSGPRVDYHESVGVVTLAGEVDLVQAQELRGRLVDVVRNEDLGLVVDLTDATYIDSVGVSLLFELADKLYERQLRLAVVVPEGGLVERVLGIVNVGSVAEIHRDVDDALSAIRAA
jgi:anti-anti-sigma factor